jgi:hypothetical protein
VALLLPEAEEGDGALMQVLACAVVNWWGSVVKSLQRGSVGCGRRCRVKLSLRWPPLCLALMVALVAPKASAQAPTKAEAVAQPGAETDPTGPQPPDAPAGAAAPSAIPAPPGELPAAQRTAEQADAQTIAELTRRVIELETKQAEAAALLRAAPVADDIELEPLRIYGFTDFGAQRIAVKRESLTAHALESNATSFVIGNLNLYFDAQPVENWRSLIEVRFTNAPQGLINNYGGIAGTFSRESTQQYDPNNTVVNATMWRASLVIERAWTEWTFLQGLKLRLGNWFTPFGIWNEDHGTPTLISMGLPQFLIQGWMPIRQTGLMAYGSTFAGDWELAYNLTFTNGRQELSNFNFGNSFGYGGRVFARRETGPFNTTLGLSFFTGENSDQVVNVVGISPVTFETTKTWEYREYVAGVDASVDIGATRIRTEAVLRRLIYTPGKRLPGNPLFGAGAVEADRWMSGGYLIVAHWLPWGGLEPFVFLELSQTPPSAVVPDGIFLGSFGLNWHINSAITWKNQLGHAWLFDWLYDSSTKAGAHDPTTIYTRLVMAF